ncbi:hypothetical protein V8F33_004900 [Rhypophila sp. PSN 637]
MQLCGATIIAHLRAACGLPRDKTPSLPWIGGLVSDVSIEQFPHSSTCSFSFPLCSRTSGCGIVGEQLTAGSPFYVLFCTFLLHSFYSLYGLSRKRRRHALKTLHMPDAAPEGLLQEPVSQSQNTIMSNHHTPTFIIMKRKKKNVSDPCPTRGIDCRRDCTSRQPSSRNDAGNPQMHTAHTNAKKARACFPSLPSLSALTPCYPLPPPFSPDLRFSGIQHPDIFNE